MALMPYVKTSDLVEVVPSKSFQLYKVIQGKEIKSVTLHLPTTKSKKRHV